MTDGRMESLWRVRQVADFLNVSVRQVYRLPIRYITVGESRRYDPADVRLYVTLQQSRAPLQRAG